MKNVHKIQYHKRNQKYFVRIQDNGTRKRFWLGESKREAPTKLKELLTLSSHPRRLPRQRPIFLFCA